MAATVLIVEDSRTQAKQLEMKLTEQGIDVLVAYDGEQGIQLAGEHHPDVIVLDVKLPKMSGHEVCKHLKDDPKTADIPVFMLSASTDPEHTMAGLQAGAEDYIPKDVFAANYLLDTLRSMGLI